MTNYNMPEADLFESPALRGLTCRAWMSKMTTEVGPPREMGMLDRMRLSVNAVATSPSSSMRSAVPVGKKGSTSVKDATNMRGSA